MPKKIDREFTDDLKLKGCMKKLLQMSLDLMSNSPIYRKKQKVIC